ncbi:hypothetical protein ABTY98_37865 [Streptomyces sp. NPDC096040]|uniref:IS1096 element passenger TnpR family protein n=1 Tax=Streptomyces sp. NPDC096040 TaxID=3155541 RepID=UPI003319DF13
MESTVHQIKATLQGIEPAVWRRLHVPSEVPLSGLHAVIQRVSRDTAERDSRAVESWS